MARFACNTIRSVLAGVLAAAALAAALAPAGLARADDATAAPTTTPAPESAPATGAPASAPATAAPAPAEKKPVPFVTAGSKGFILDSGDGKFTLRVRGHLQADGRIFPVKAEPGTTSFVIRSIRFINEGTLWSWFDFRLAVELGEGKFDVREAYLDIHPWKFLRLRAGKFKEPFGLERLQTDTTINFVERAFPTQLAPNRDIGLQLWGDVADGTLWYAFGIFDGVPDGGSTDGDSSDDKDFAARVFLQPFEKLKVEALARLGVGFAITWGAQLGKVDAPNLPSFKSPGQVTIFSYLVDTAMPDLTVIADGPRFRLSPQAYWYWGPVGLLFEYVRSSQAVTRDVDSARLTHTAWQIAAYFALGGTETYEGVKVKRPLAPGSEGWGAVEVGVRFHELDLDDASFPTYADPEKSVSLARTLGGGVHWYLNDNVKLALDYEHSFFIDGATGPAARKPEDVLLARFQVGF
jgi:phosphate-selective porin OprO/OprP